jgi:glycosyltransferase involved in cell wall biosynthesis
MNKIKILFLIPRYYFGGAERQLIYLLKNIDKDEFDVRLGLLYKDEDTPYHKIKGISVVSFDKSGKFDAGVFLRIKRYLSENRIDIVQSFLGNHHAWLPALFCKGTKAVGGIRSTIDHQLSAIEKFTRFTMPALGAKWTNMLLISNSEAGRDIYLKHGYPPSMVSVIPNGIDTRLFVDGDGRKIRKELGLLGKTVIGNVSRLDPEKHHEVILKAFSELSARHDDLALIIVGDGPLRPTLEKEAEGLGIRDKVVFTGNRTDVGDILHAMDIYAMASAAEGWPNALGEAMTAGLPAVAYPSGDVDRIVKSGENGIVVEPNIRLFISALEDLIHDKTKRRRLGRAGRETIMDKFTIKNMVRSYEQLYRSLV